MVVAFHKYSQTWDKVEQPIPRIGSVIFIDIIYNLSITNKQMNTISGQPLNSNHVMGNTHTHKLGHQGKESLEMQHP